MRDTEREKRTTSNTTMRMNKATDCRMSKVITGTERPLSEPAVRGNIVQFIL